MNEGASGHAAVVDVKASDLAAYCGQPQCQAEEEASGMHLISVHDGSAERCLAALEVTDQQRQHPSVVQGKHDRRQARTLTS